MKGFYQVTFDHAMYIGFTEEFIRLKDEVAPMTAVPLECLWIIYSLAQQSLKRPGVFMECGVDRGGSAKVISEAIKGYGRELHLFDTFSGMPETNPEIDRHVKGDFPDSSVERVQKYVEGAILHPGIIPHTFSQIETIAFAHVDCDIYSSTKACCEFIFPRLKGAMIFDDYGRHTTEGVRLAVDEYFQGRDAFLIPNMTSGQMVVIK